MWSRPLSDEELEKRLAGFVPGGVQWFPGHMAKTLRDLNRHVALANVIVEVVDARVPGSGRYQELSTIIKDHAHVIALTKTDLADPAATRSWAEQMRGDCQAVFPVDAQRGKGIGALLAHVRKMAKVVRVIVIGVPNSGKSSLINRASARAGARVGARPGITRGPQWLRAGPGIEFLDTPGLLWPRIDAPLQGLKLAWVASVGENAYDAYTVGSALGLWLSHYHPRLLTARYEIDEGIDIADPETLLEHVGRRLGYLMAGGAVNTENAARALLSDFRSARIGRVTLDFPPC
jgi:ribosome biogenesis GTPase A